MAWEEANPPRTIYKLLQVLGGKAKRKRLLSPKGVDVRSMMEVVIGADFDILQLAIYVGPEEKKVREDPSKYSTKSSTASSLDKGGYRLSVISKCRNRHSSQQQMH